MLERFDEHAREVIGVAGELAARRARERSGADFPHHVRIRLADLREALSLVAPEHGFAGHFDRYATARLERLRSTRGRISVKELREVLR